MGWLDDIICPSCPRGFALARDGLPNCLNCRSRWVRKYGYSSYESVSARHLEESQRDAQEYFDQRLAEMETECPSCGITRTEMMEMSREARGMHKYHGTPAGCAKHCRLW
jgi:hypothetical protein